MPRGPSAVPRTVVRLVFDFATFLRLGLQSRAHLAAENLFLRRQLALYLERQVKPRRADAATRVALVLLARCIDWKPMLTVVKRLAHALISFPADRHLTNATGRYQARLEAACRHPA